jgi:hypothetical protein
MGFFRWGHIQKARLKFLAIYHKLENNQPSGLVKADLLPDTKKAYYKQEGKQFIHEQAWMITRTCQSGQSLCKRRLTIPKIPNCLLVLLLQLPILKPILPMQIQMM